MHHQHKRAGTLHGDADRLIAGLDVAELMGHIQGSSATVCIGCALRTKPDPVWAVRTLTKLARGPSPGASQLKAAHRFSARDFPKTANVMRDDPA